MDDIKHKKIGILTFHRAHNYGAVLQCYALQEVLRALGYDAYVTDYRQPAIEGAYGYLNLKYFCKKLIHPRGMYHYFKRIAARMTHPNVFKDFRDNFFRRASLREKMDIYMIGSDQLWNTAITEGVDHYYTGRFRKSKEQRIYTYAVSGNLCNMQLTGDAELQKCCENIDVLSFREKSLSDYIQTKTGRTVRTDLDPTLLSDVSLWNKMTTDEFKGEHYVFLYQLRTPQDDSKAIERMAESLAQKAGCKVVKVKASETLKYSPQQFLSLVRSSQYVVTNSFHGTVFSLIFGRPLYSVRMRDGGGDNRYVNLLQALGAENLLVEVGEDLPLSGHDTDNIQPRLKELRVDSLSYLSQL